MASAGLIPGRLFAESSYERELKELADQRDKAVAAAIDPINRRYQTALEQLLKRATQANDLATAVKIKTELDRLAPPTPEASLLSKLSGTKWNWRGSGTEVATFTNTGEMHLSKSKAKIQVAGARKIILTSIVTKRTATLTFNAAVTEFTGTDFDGHTPVAGAILK